MILGMMRYKGFEPTYELGVYERLRDRALVCGKWVKQIDLDVNRTYRDNEIFAKRYGNKCVNDVVKSFSVPNLQTTKSLTCTGRIQRVECRSGLLSGHESRSGTASYVHGR